MKLSESSASCTYLKGMEELISYDINNTAALCFTQLCFDILYASLLFHK